MCVQYLLKTNHSWALKVAKFLACCGLILFVFRFVQPYRELAMSRISQVYENAHAVLVLDKSLEMASCKITRGEVGIRVISSRWMQRLWTLAEGCRA